jgi:hypothetical protein
MDLGMEGSSAPAAFRAVDEMATRVCAVACDAGCTAARAPADQCAARQQRVAGWAACGCDVDYSAIGKLADRTHVRLSHNVVDVDKTQPAARSVGARRPTVRDGSEHGVRHGDQRRMRLDLGCDAVFGDGKQALGLSVVLGG